jgi:hypothetical protein
MKLETPPKLPSPSPNSMRPPFRRVPPPPFYEKYMKYIGGGFLFLSAVATEIFLLEPLASARRNDPVVMITRKGIFIAGVFATVGLTALIYGPGLIKYLRNFRHERWNTKKWALVLLVILPTLLLFTFFEWELNRLGYGGGK